MSTLISNLFLDALNTTIGVDTQQVFYNHSTKVVKPHNECHTHNITQHLSTLL